MREPSIEVECREIWTTWVPPALHQLPELPVDLVVVALADDDDPEGFGRVGPVTAKLCVLATSRIGCKPSDVRCISGELLTLCRSSGSLVPAKGAVLVTVLNSNFLPKVLSAQSRVG